MRSREDPALVERVWCAERIPLTVCPLSNLKLKVIDSLADSTLKKLLDAGVAVTVNSDDPAYFGGYIADNFRAATAALGLTSRRSAHARRATRFSAPSRATSARRELLGELEAAFAGV